MSESIIKGLTALDPSNDSHWTTDGQPRLDIVRTLASDPTVSREGINKVAPGFSRSAPIITGGTEVSPQTSAQPAEQQAATVVTPTTETAPQAQAPEKVAAPASEGAAQTTESEPKEVDTVESVTKEMEQVQEAMSYANEQRSAWSSRVEECQNRIHVLQNKLARLAGPGPNSQTAIQKYLENQKKLLSQRSVIGDALRSMDFDPVKLAKSLQSPLDAALARKR